MIFGRTDLWISQSRAKFEEEADFEALKHIFLAKKRNFRSETFAEKKFFGIEKRNVRNRLKRVLGKFWWKNCAKTARKLTKTSRKFANRLFNLMILFLVQLILAEVA